MTYTDFACHNRRWNVQYATKVCLIVKHLVIASSLPRNTCCYYHSVFLISLTPIIPKELQTNTGWAPAWWLARYHSCAGSPNLAVSQGHWRPILQTWSHLSQSASSTCHFIQTIKSNVTMTTGQMFPPQFPQLGTSLYMSVKEVPNHIFRLRQAKPHFYHSGWCCFIASGMLGLQTLSQYTLRPQVHDFGCSMSSKDVLFVIPLWLICRLSSLLGERLVWQTTKPGANKGLPS